MAVTMNQVLAEIDRDEPDYKVLSALGADALTHLAQIAEADDPLRAAKAAYAASLIGGLESIDLLKKAANHRDPQVRVALAHGLRSSADPSIEVLDHLLDDADVGVRKVALNAAGSLGKSELRGKVQAIAKSDPHDFLREAATNIVKLIKK